MIQFLALQIPGAWQEILIGFAFAGLAVNTTALVTIASLRTKVKRLEESNSELENLLDAVCEAFTSHTGLTIRTNGKNFKGAHHGSRP